ncbi:MAG: sugar-binding domain-containing protein [Syntrophomonas sp.]|nr:sugar-binding domain-containing protein [Syntrophomonas sp.]
MDKIFSVMESLAPEAIQIMHVRYMVLRQILHNQPVGRRQLGKKVGLSERLVRAEVDTLKVRGALHITQAGVYLTDYGEEMLREIDEIVPWLFNIQILGEKLKERFGLDEVVIVPGNSSINSFTQEDLGRAGAEYLRKKLYPSCILAVTGGTTLAQVANAMREGINVANVCVVPARGGLGENVEQQAGSIAAKIAQAIGAQYRMLHIPDNLEKSTAAALIRDIHISEIVNTIKSAHILMHGIGPAMDMARRRGLSELEVEFLQKHEAMGEALRYYFDRWGKIIFEIPGIGLDRNDLHNIKQIVAVAGGSNKADAIEAVLKNGQENVLITDEGAAKKIMSRKDDGQ